ncbi:uncharacterized protein UHOD_11780 [Ustilago sp. UG-2017b]|nr:uncharacterized protein UHOD_11780 [Ustilago sp. UG-2017b]
MHVFLIVAVITAVVAFASDDPPARMVRIPMEQALSVPERYDVHNVGDDRTVSVWTWAAPAAAQHTDGSSEAASRSAQEAAGSRHLASLAPAPPEPGNRRPAFQTLDGEPLRWIFDTSAASSSTGPPETRQIIPEFIQVESGRAWGPLPIGDEKFSMKSYPVNIPLFEHLYGDTHAVPDNFENFVTDRPIQSYYQDADTFPNEPPAPAEKRIDARGMSYRPEPVVLQAVHDTIWQHLRQGGMQPKKLYQSDVFQGEYLWPPVEADRDSEHLILMSKLLRHYRNAISLKFRNALSGGPSMFHLEVNVNGQIRHILMFPTTRSSRVKQMYALSRSKLWLLYEGMIIPPGRQQFALLGATYLPNEAHGYLHDHGVLRVAFAEHMNVLH